MESALAGVAQMRGPHYLPLFLYIFSSNSSWAFLSIPKARTSSPFDSPPSTTTLLLGSFRYLSSSPMDRHIDNHQSVVNDALKLLKGRQKSDLRLQSWKMVLCDLLQSVSCSTAGQHTTSNPTGTLLFPTNLETLNSSLTNPFVYTVCATSLSDAILLFFQEYVSSADKAELSVAAQKNSPPAESGRLRAMFDPLLSFVAFVTILYEYQGDIHRTWSAYALGIGNSHPTEPVSPSLVSSDPINLIFLRPWGWRVILALFFGVVDGHRPPSLRHTSITIPHYDVRSWILGRWVHAFATRGTPKVAICGQIYLDAMKKYSGDVAPSLLAEAFARGGYESLKDFVGGTNIDKKMGITDLLIPDELAEMARAHFELPRVHLDPIKAAIPNYEQLEKIFDRRGTEVRRYKVRHPTDASGAFYVLVLDNIFSARAYGWIWWLLTKGTAFIVPDGMTKGNSMLSVSTKPPDWHPDAVFAIGSGNGGSGVKFYQCKKSNTKLEEALYRVLNLVLASLSEGIAEYLAQNGGPENCDYHHHWINTILTNLFDTVKVGFGPHGDSDPTNSRNPGESYEDSYLPLASELVSCTVCLPSPELFTNLECPEAGTAVYKYSASASGTPLLPVIKEGGFEDSKQVEVGGNGLSIQGQLSQFQCFHSVSMKHSYRCHKNAVRFIASARKQPLHDQSSSLDSRLAVWEKSSRQSFKEARRLTKR